MALDSSYELDFNEIGNWRGDGFFIVNLLRMMMLEPYNLYINADIGTTGAEFLPNRLCQIFNCPPLTQPDNLVGTLCFHCLLSNLRHAFCRKAVN